jgi:hypothetical protein
VRSHRRRHLRAEWAVLAQRLIEGAAPPAQFVIVQQLAWRHLTTGPLSTVINFVRCRHCCTWRAVRGLQNVAIMRQNNLLKMVIPLAVGSPHPRRRQRKKLSINKTHPPESNTVPVHIYEIKCLTITPLPIFSTYTNIFVQKSR